MNRTYHMLKAVFCITIGFLTFYAPASQPHLDSLEAALEIIEVAAKTDPWYAKFLKGITDAQIDPRRYAREIIITAVTALVHTDNQGRSLPINSAYRAHFRKLVDVPSSHKEVAEYQSVSDIWESISEDTASVEDVGAVSAKRCVKPRNAQAVFQPIFNPGRRPDTCICQDLFVRGTATINTLNVLGNTDIGGNLRVQGLFYLDSDTINPNNILYVQKSPITAPNQFNSVTAALAAITDNSQFNPYVIRITPGFFFEPPLAMKPFVAVQGSGNATILITILPNQDLIIGANSAILRDVTLAGAIAPGSSAIVFNSGGAFLVIDTIFGGNDIFASVINAPNGTLLAISRSEIFPIVQFTEGVRVVQAAPAQAGVYMSETLWNPVVVTTFTNFFRASGPGAFCSGGLFALGNNPITSGLGAAQGGIGALVENGARLQFTSCGFVGFDQAFLVTNAGSAPQVFLTSVFADGNVTDLQVDHAFTTGSVTGVMDDEKVIINPSNTTLSFFITDPETGSVTTQGDFKWGQVFNQRTTISPLFNSGWNTGVTTGGALLFDTSSLVITATAGTGYLMQGVEPTDFVTYVEWDTQSIALPANLDSFVFIDHNGALQSSAAEPAVENAILLGKARTSNTGVVFVQEFPTDARHTGERLTTAIENSLGPIYISGSLVSSSTANQLNVGQGSYVFGTHQYSPSGGNPVSFSTWLLSGSGGYIIGNPLTNVVDASSYDNGTGTLDTIPTGSYVKDLLYIAGDGIYETYLFQYGQALFDTLTAAQNGTIPPMPGNWSGNIARIAGIIVNNNQIVSIEDERPRPAFVPSTTNGVTVHGDLTGLLADDHPQYLLVNGARAMVGDLNMGGNDIITGGGFVDGVDVALHGARHGANDVDPLPLGIPVSVGLINDPGISNAYPRVDHVHAHDNQPGGTLHALATTSVAGFMSPADKTAIDSIVTLTGNFVKKTGDDMSGPLIMTSGTPVDFQVTFGAQTVHVQAPTSMASTYNWIFPVNTGSSGQVLSTDGIGNLAWITAGSGNINNGGNAFGAPISIGTQDNFGLSLITNNIPALTIANSGAVGINAPTSGVGLTVAGNAGAAAEVITAGVGQSALDITGASGAPSVTISSNASQNSVQASSGASGNPAYSFIGSTSTGLYSPGVNQVALSTNGTPRLSIGATGLVTLASLGIGVVQSSAAGLLSSSAGANGQLLIGAGVGAAPVWANITSTGSTIAITNGAGTINLEAGGAVAISFATNSGSATPAAGVLTISGGSNINTSGAGSTVTVNLNNSPSVSGSLTAGTTITAGTGITATTGNIAALAGNVSASGTVAAGTTMTAGTGITATTGNIAASAGNVSASGTLTAGTTLLTAAGTAAAPSQTFTGDTNTGMFSPGADQIALSTNGTSRLSIGATGLVTLTSLGIGVVQSSAAGLLSSSAGANGRLLIGAGVGAAPVWANITSTGSTIAITNGAGTINLEAGGAVAISFATNSGSATPAAGVLTIAGGSNINTSGAGSTVTVNLNNSPSVSGSLTAGTGITATTGNIAAAAGNVSASGTLTAGTTVLTAAGTAAAPSHTFTGNITTGMFSPGANQIALSTNSTARLNIGTTGLVTLSSLGLGVVQSSGAGLLSSSNGTNGQLLIGNTGVAPVWANITSTGSTIAITNGAGTINLEAGAAVPTSFATNSGSATPAAGVLTISGGSNINTSGAGSTVTVNLNNSPSVSGSLTAGTGITATTGNIVASSGNISASGSVTAGTTLVSAAGTAAAPSHTFTGNTTSGMFSPGANQVALSTNSTSRLSIGTTGLVTLNSLGLGVVQSSAAGLLSSSNGTNGQLLIGNTGVAPVWANITSTGNTISITNGAGTINLESGGAVATSFLAGTGTATPAAGVLTVPNGSNINTSGAGSTLTVNLVNSPSVSGSLTAGTGVTATTGNIAASAGNVSASGTVTAGTTMTAGTGITATTGNIVASSGSVSASGSVTAGTTIVSAAGTAAAPSHTFTGNTTSGMFSPGANQVALSTNSTARLSIGTTGLVTLSSLGLGVVQSSAAGLLSSSNGTNGQLLIGNTGVAPAWANITSTGGTVAITNGTGTINLEIGGTVASSFATNSGTATPAAGVLTISGGSNINTSGAGSTVTVNLNNSPSVSGSLNAGTTVTAGTGITATTGNIVASSGNVSASGTVTGGTGVTATTGNITASSGNVSASGIVTAGVGAVGAPSYTFAGNTTTGLYLPAAGQFGLSAAGVNKLSYDGSSVISASNYKVRAYNTGTQSIPASGTLTLTFPTESFDPAGNFASPTYTAPITGVYLVIFNAQVTGTVNNQTITLNLTNNVGTAYTSYTLPARLNLPTSGAFSNTFGWTQLISLTAGQTLQVRATNSLASAATVSANASLAIHYMSF